MLILEVAGFKPVKLKIQFTNASSEVKKLTYDHWLELQGSWLDAASSAGVLSLDAPTKGREREEEGRRG